MANDMPRAPSVKVPERCALFGDADLDRVIAWRGGAGITRRVLLANAARIAATLPEDRPIANACVDRYNFLVVLVAVLARGQIVLLPADSTPPGLAALQRRYDRLLCLTDQKIDGAEDEVRTVWFDGLSTSAPVDVPLIDPTAPAVTLFTSGSTGEPVPTVRNWAWLTTTVRHYQDGLGIKHLRNLNVLATVPAQHAYGLEGAIMVPLCSDATVNATMPLFPRDIATGLNDMPAPRALLTTPFHLRVLLDSRLPVPDLAVIISAAAHLPAELAAQAEAQCGAPVMEIYGCTEVGLIGSRRTVDGEMWSLPTDLELHTDETGATVAASHLGAPVELADDIEQLSDSSFRMHGRVSEIVKIAGKRASLSGLNSALLGINGVDDGMFVLWPEDRHATNRRLVAFAVAPERDLDEIRRDLRAVVPAPFLPRRLFRVPAIPRNSTGKIRHSDLLALAQKVSDAK